MSGPHQEAERWERRVHGAGISGGKDGTGQGGWGGDAHRALGGEAAQVDGSQSGSTMKAVDLILEQ